MADPIERVLVAMELRSGNTAPQRLCVYCRTKQRLEAVEPDGDGLFCCRNTHQCERRIIEYASMERL